MGHETTKRTVRKGKDVGGWGHLVHPNTRARKAEGERKGAAGEEGEGVDWGQSISQKEKRCEIHLSRFLKKLSLREPVAVKVCPL